MKPALIITNGPELRLLTDTFKNNCFKNGLLLFCVLESKEFIDYGKKNQLPYVVISQKPTINNFFYNQARLIQSIRFFKKMGILGIKNNRYSNIPIILLNTVFFIFYKFFKLKPLKWDILENVIKHNGITHLYFAGYNSPECIFGLSVANKLKIQTIVVQNSWKDFEINPFVAYPPKEMYVWSDKIRDSYKFLNKNLIKTNLNVLLHPRLADLTDFTRDENIRNSKSLKLLYICANPKLVKNENLLIRELFKYMDDGIEIIIRPNPMDSDMEKWSEFKSEKNYSVEFPGWYWNSENDINIAPSESEKKWKHLLYSVDLVLGTASTAIIEAAIVKKPFLVINFHKDEPNNNAYYKNLLNYPAVFQHCHKSDNINDKINQILNTSISFDHISNYLI